MADTVGEETRACQILKTTHRVSHMTITTEGLTDMASVLTLLRRPVSDKARTDERPIPVA
jgi:hypothetical protein